MTRIKLSELHGRLADLDYPTAVGEVDDAIGDVVIEVADGEFPLRDVLDDLGGERYGSPDELEADVFGALPTEAVGEPGQSEGDA